jgi:hypothetical protein
VGDSNIPLKNVIVTLSSISELTIFELYNLNGMKKIILLSLVAGLAWSAGFAQGPMRGEEDLQATQKSLEMGLLVEEMEEAGFVLDINEGFDEEWEEGTWLAAEGDDLDVVNLRDEDAELFAIDSEVEAWIEEDSEETVSIAEEAEVLTTEEVAFEEVATFEEESDDLYMGEEEEEEVTEEGAWWNETETDDSWDEIEDEWELEALENSYEEDDMEVLEALYERG